MLTGPESAEVTDTIAELEWVAPFTVDVRRTLSVQGRGRGDPTFATDEAGAIWRTSLTPDGPGTIGLFHEKFGRDARVWDKNRVVIIPDHYIFTADEKCHRNVQILRDFVREQGLKYYYDPEFVTSQPGMPNPYKDPTKTNYKGVCHKALPEEGHIRPGEILIGTDHWSCSVI